MAVTKIHAIKSTLGKAIKYIINEQKTDSHVLVTSFGCAPQTADLEFNFWLSKNSEGGPNLAYHMIQSFAPGEITGEEAHRISQELADRFLQGKYAYVLATHVDRDHIHSHIIFCAVNTETHKKYHGCTANYYKLRSISDRLCAEHGKSVIKDFKEAGKTYHEWYHNKKGDSWKAQLKKDINECVKKAVSYDEFLRLMREKGYEINGETFGEGSAKYISFRPYGKDRFVRGRANTLGVEYTKECIRERIEEKAAIRTDQMLGANTIGGSAGGQNHSNEYHGINTDLINTETKKMAENPGLRKWGIKNNLKTIAATYAEFGRQGIQSGSSRAEHMRELQNLIRQEQKTVNNLSKEIEHFRDILRHARYYTENKRYDTAYEKSKDKDRYYNDHYNQLELFWAAKNWLGNAGIDTTTLNLKQIEEHCRKLIADKDALTASYTSKQTEIEQLKKAEDSLYKFLHISEKERDIPEKTKDKNHNRSLP